MPTQTEQTQQVIDTAIRLGVVGLIIYSCLQIFNPFVLPVAWGIIIAVAVYPLHQRIESALGGRSRLALAVFVLFGLTLLIVPSLLLAESVVDAIQGAWTAYEDGSLHVPPPSSSVKEWPVVGERLYATWSAANQNLTATLERFSGQLTHLATKLLAGAASAGGTVLQFLISILIAAVLMANAEGGRALAHAIGRRLAGEAGADFADLATATTRSVAQGVLGVALIQAILSGVGMLAVGVPAAGLWALLVLVLAIVQLPPLLVLAPAIVYVFSASATVPAVLFMIWGIIVSASDAFLKPLLLGRGLDVPMLVILIGAIGGMMVAGVIGLFVGAVVLALAYKLFMAWLEPATQPAAAVAE